MVEKADEGFTLVPISSSEASVKLRVLHAQRVIAAQLQKIIWQPFSSEETQRNPKYVSIFRHISEGLINGDGKGSGPRAARLYAALTMRSLQSKQAPELPLSTSKASTPLPDRAQAFCDKVMAILSLLVKPSLYPEFRNSLLDLAMSAISVWNIAQTDEREVIVDLNIDPTALEGWSEDNPETGYFVLFPRIIARSCSRIIDSRPPGPPGSWVLSEPELHIQEICIYGGAGLGKWLDLVEEGEEEEEDRKEEEHIMKVEEQRKMLEEGLKKLNPVILKRRMSHHRKDSNASSVSPSALWAMGGGGQKISENDE